MKLMRNILVALALSAVGVASLGQSDVSAWSERIVAPAGDIRVDASERPKGSLYVYAPSGEALITGKVDGDLYCAAESVRIDAEVKGSINCAGLKITLNGKVGEGARLAAQEIEVEGRVGGDMSALATSLKVAKSAEIAGDLNGAVSSLSVDGPVGGIFGSMGQVNINSEVESLDVVARSISLGSSARVAGDANYQVSGDGKVKIDKSKVGGEVKVEASEVDEDSPFITYLYGLSFTIAIILSLATVTLLPFSRVYRGVYESTSTKMPIVLLVGFMVLFAAPTVFLFLVLTIVGLPVVLALLVFWVSILLASVGYVIYVLGLSLSQVQVHMTPIWSYIAASVLLGLAFSLPLVGPAVLFMALIYGSGSLVFAIFNHQFGSRRGGSVKSASSKARLAVVDDKVDTKN